MEIVPIAYIRTGFSEKFGIPRQSGLAPSVEGRVIFEPEYRCLDALRGLDGFSHIWLIWGFSANIRQGWQPVVRPPRLGGNMHMGVFATRSPFRPNGLGLSCVELAGIDRDCSDGPVIIVRGADLMDMTPIYDIKPYIRYADSRPDSSCGYVEPLQDKHLEVMIDDDEISRIGCSEVVEQLKEMLSLDPRPSYHDDSQREYGLSYAGYNVRFKVDGDSVFVTSID